MDMKMRDFSALLASKEPAPGGGSVSALAGVLAAALGGMAVQLTTGKKAFETTDADVKEAVNNAGAKLEELRERLTLLVDEDTEAYNAYRLAFKMPKSTETEKAVRKTAIDAAEEVIVKVPYSTLSACFEVFPHLAVIARYGNKNCISDVAVAANVAFAGMEGGMYNVLTNKVDDEKRAFYKAEFDRMLSEASQHRNKIIRTAKEIFDESAN